jgi:hypothetical protein
MEARRMTWAPVIDLEPLPIAELCDPFAEEAAPSKRAALAWRIAEFLATEQLADLETERAQLLESLGLARAALKDERATLLTIIGRARDHMP